jgi:hypothetical protein
MIRPREADVPVPPGKPKDAGKAATVNRLRAIANKTDPKSLAALRTFAKDFGLSIQAPYDAMIGPAGLDALEVFRERLRASANAFAAAAPRADRAKLRALFDDVDSALSLFMSALDSGHPNRSSLEAMAEAGAAVGNADLTLYRYGVARGLWK